MTKKTLLNKFTLVALLFSISVACFIGFFAVKASAENKVSVSSLVYAHVADVEIGAGTGNAVTPLNKGVKLSSKTGATNSEWSVGINGVFSVEEENSLEFNILGTSNDNFPAGEFNDVFSFRISDYENPEKFFDIEIATLSTYLYGIGVRYNGVLHARAIGSAILYNTYDQSPGGTYPYSTGSMLCAYNGEENAGYNGKYSKIALVKNGQGLLEVRANYFSSGAWRALRNVATFDGTESSGDLKKNFGLPLISEVLPSGKFTIDISSGIGGQSAHLVKELLLHSVNGTVLGESDVVRPTWNSAAEARVEYVFSNNFDVSSLKYNPNKRTFGEEGLTLVAPVLGNGDVFTRWLLNGEPVTSLPFVADKTYTLTAEVTIAGKKPIENDFKVYSGAIASGKGTNREQTAAARGVLLSSAADVNEYRAELKRLFDTDKENEIRFLLTNPVGNRTGNTELFNIRIKDALDATKFFDVRVVSVGGSYIGCYVIYYTGGREKAVSTKMIRGQNAYSGFLNGYSYIPNDNTADSAYCWGVDMVNSAAYNGNYCTISFKTSGNYFEIYANFIAQGSWNTRLIARFDGKTDFVDMVSFGLPYIREVIPSGKYVMEFSSGIDLNGTSNLRKTTNVLINSIGKYNFGSHTEAYEPDWCAEYNAFYATGKNYVRVKNDKLVNKYYDTETFFYVPEAEYVKADGSVSPVSDILIKAEGGEWVNFTSYAGSYIEPFGTPGNYIIRFVGDALAEDGFFETDFTVFNRKMVSKTITVNEKVLETQASERGIYVPNAEYVYTDYTDFSPMKVEKVLIKRVSAKVWTDISEYVGKVYYGISQGEYVLRYIAADGGVTEDNHKDLFFKAIDNYIDNANLFSTEGVANYSYEYAGETNSGILIDNALNGKARYGKSTINAVFTDKFSITVSLANAVAATESYFIRAESVTDENEYFYVAIYGGKAFVIDKYAKASLNSGSTLIQAFTYNTGTRKPGFAFSPNECGYSLLDFSKPNLTSGTLSFGYENGAFTVKAEGVSGSRVLARFDGKTSDLQPLNFNCGYKVSLENACECNVSLIIEDVCGRKLSYKYLDRNLNPETLWEKNYKTGYAIMVDDFGAVKYDSYVTVPAASYAKISGATVSENGITDVKLKAGETLKNVKPGDKLKLADGDYSFVYTAPIEDGTFGKVRIYDFTVKSGGVNSSEIFTDVTGNVYKNYSVGGKYGHYGVMIKPDDNNALSGKFNGVFNGDVSFAFSFPLTETFSNQEFTFKVAGVADPSDYFIISLKEGANGTTAIGVIDKHGKYRGLHNDGAGIVDGAKYGLIDTHFNSQNGIPSFGGKNWGAATIALVWDDDVLNVIVKGNDTRVFGTFRIARFDGTSSCSSWIRENDGNPTYGLDKLSFKDAYTVSFSGRETSVLFESIGKPSYEKLDDVTNSSGGITSYRKGMVSLSVTDKFELGGNGVPKENLALYGYRFIESGAITSSVVETGTTRGAVTFEELGVGARFKYSIKPISGFELINEKTIYPDEEIDFTVSGEYTYEFEEFGHSVTVKLIVTRGGTNISFKNGKSHLIYALNAVDKIYISPYDVTASDPIDGVIEDVIVSLKTPSATDFVITEGEFVFASVGDYVVRYSVTNSAGITTNLDRTITVKSGCAPVITVHGEIKNEYFTSEKLTIPEATAVSGGKSTSVKVVVTKDGKILDLTGNSILLEKGSYEINYYAVDTESGLESVKRYAFTVKPNNNVPVIGEVEFPESVKKGDKVTISMPEVSANGASQLEVKVYFGKNEIVVTDGYFIPNEAGAYRVVYTVKDTSGNKAEKTIILIVYDK